MSTLQRTSAGSALALPAILLSGVGFIAWAGTNAEVASAIPVLLILAVVTSILLGRVLRGQPDPIIRRIIIAGFMLKIAAVIVRYYVAFDVYGGVADAAGYHGAGVALFPQIREGIFSVDTGRGYLSTGAVRYLTGLLYAVVGPSLIGAFFAFGWLAVWGQYGFLRGVQMALPHADHRRYAALVMLLPSLLYWPASLGKESIAVFGLGVAVSGAGRIYSGRAQGVLITIVGTAIVATVRPHVGLMAAAALFVGFLMKGVRSRGTAGRPVNPAVFVIAVALMVALFVPLLSTAQRFLGLDDEGRPQTDQIQEVLQFRGGQSEQGGSEFRPTPVTSPRSFLTATATVLFRPFPFEANNVQSLATSVESMTLLVLSVVFIRPRALVAQIGRQPLVLAAVVYCVAFIVAFSIIGNFGILARQRVQLLPWFLILLCACPSRRTLSDGPPSAAGSDAVSSTPGTQQV